MWCLCCSIFLSDLRIPKYLLFTLLLKRSSSSCGDLRFGWLNLFLASAQISSKLIESTGQHGFPWGEAKACGWLWCWQPQSNKHTAAQCKDSVNHDSVISFNRASFSQAVRFFIPRSSFDGTSFQSIAGTTNSLISRFHLLPSLNPRTHQAILNAIHRDAVVAEDLSGVRGTLIGLVNLQNTMRRP